MGDRNVSEEPMGSEVGFDPPISIDDDGVEGAEAPDLVEGGEGDDGVEGAEAPDSVDGIPDADVIGEEIAPDDGEVANLDDAEPDAAEDGLATEWHYSENPPVEGAPQNGRPEDSPIYDQMVAEARARGEEVT